ncbi:MAG: response regulator [Verrucomicrobiota bacterium]
MKSRVLVVEDEGLVGRDVQVSLEQMGFDAPRVASSGEEALAAVRESPPDLVLLDICLSGEISGIELARRLREDHETPFVFITGMADDETLRVAQKTGPQGFLLKPFNSEQLQSAVESALAGYRAIQELRLRETRQSGLLETASEGVIATDLAGLITYLNPEAESLTGWSSEEALHQPLQDVFKSLHDTGQLSFPFSQNGNHGVEEGAIQTTLVTRGGERLPIQELAQPLRDGREGGSYGVVVTFRRREQSEKSESTETSWRQLGSILESISDPLLTVNPLWQVTYANGSVPEALGLAGTDEIVGRSLWKVVPEVASEPLFQHLGEAQRERSRASFELDWGDGEMAFSIQAYPFAEGLLLILQDISELRAARRVQGQLQQLEGLGFLARGFAHDFNNLLTVQVNGLESLREWALSAPDLPDEIVEALQDVEDTTERSGDLVHQLLTFAKGGAPVKETFAPQELLERLLQRHPVPEGVQVEARFGEEIPEISADRRQMQRLVNNLLENAIAAMPQGGELALHARAVDRAQAEEQGLPGALAHPNWLEICLMDSGEGIPEANLDRVFEPYFTTWSASNSSGLGLTVCDLIVKAHDGFMKIWSKPGEGTSVFVFLPAEGKVRARKPEPIAGKQRTASPPLVKAGNPFVDQKLEGEERAPLSPVVSKAPTSAKAGGSSMNGSSQHAPARILVLEDEALIRKLLVTQLQREGFELVETWDGLDTLREYQAALEAGSKFDLVILDLTIVNGLGGIETMARLKEMDPSVVAIVSSGYSDDPAMAQPEAFGFSGVLPKPYQPEGLRRIVRETIAQG